MAFGLWLELVVLFAACLLAVSLMVMTDMNCVAEQQATMCPMAVVEWVSGWQYFVAPAFVTSTLVLLAIFFALLIGSGLWLPYTITSPPAGYHWRKLFEPWVALVNYLTQQFSEGILHPKIY